jgi:hypothetical protein
MTSSAILNPFDDNIGDENDDAIENIVVGPDIHVSETESNVFNDGGGCGLRVGMLFNSILNP